MKKISPGPAGDGTDTARHRALAAASRVRMLHLVRGAEGGLSAAEVSHATGLHPNTVRAHLDQLAASGLLIRYRQGDGSPGRPAWRYRAAPGSDATSGDDGDHRYRDLAAVLIGHLARNEDDPHAAGIRAGRDWGRGLAAGLGRVAPLEGLTRVLERLGFAPHVAARGRARRSGSGSGSGSGEWTTIHLTACPFLDLAETNPDVVCGVHLGVIGGALGALGASAETDLRPFAAPGACVIHLQLGRAGVSGHHESGDR